MPMSRASAAAGDSASVVDAHRDWVSGGNPRPVKQHRRLGRSPGGREQPSAQAPLAARDVAVAYHPHHACSRALKRRARPSGRSWSSVVAAITQDKHLIWTETDPARRRARMAPQRDCCTNEWRSETVITVKAERSTASSGAPSFGTEVLRSEQRCGSSSQCRGRRAGTDEGNAQLDRQQVTRKFGVAVQLRLPSSAAPLAPVSSPRPRFPFISLPTRPPRRQRWLLESIAWSTLPNSSINSPPSPTTTSPLIVATPTMNPSNAKTLPPPHHRAVSHTSPPLIKMPPPS